MRNGSKDNTNGYYIDNVPALKKGSKTIQVAYSYLDELGSKGELTCGKLGVNKRLKIGCFPDTKARI